MFMQTELILIILLGGLIALDNTEIFQSMLSQPLLVGPVVGCLLSDLEGGVKIGILLQMAYLWVMPVGTANFPDPSVGSVVGSSGFILLGRFFPDRSDLVLVVIILFSIPFFVFCGWSLIKQRQLNFGILSRADACVEQGRTANLRKLFILALTGSFLRGVVLTLIGLFCVLVLLKPIIGVLDFLPDLNPSNIELPVWGVGMGSIIYLFGKKGNLVWSMGGVMLGIILLLV
jgi:mannose/fructose/N-acetylgalactosamine-specific phosphotransferase system component IIC